MKKILFILILVVCYTIFAFSQTNTYYTFLYVGSDDPSCCPNYWNDYWRSSHGSPGYAKEPNNPLWLNGHFLG